VVVDRRVAASDQDVAGLPRRRTDDPRAGRHARPRRADKRRGIPQGSPLSPAAGEYLHAPVRVWVEEARPWSESLGTSPRHLLPTTIVIPVAGGAAPKRRCTNLREIMGKLELTVETRRRQRICAVPEGSSDFLGFTFGQMYSARTRPGLALGYRAVKGRASSGVVEKVPRADPSRSTYVARKPQSWWEC